MAAGDNEVDRQEVDRLVEALLTRKSAPAPPRPPVIPAVAAQPIASPSVEAPPDAPPVQRPRAPGSSGWSTVRILMPATAPGARKTTPFALSLPNWPVFKLPAISEETRQTILVYTWVLLGVLLSVSMLYWPYPKTYLVGLVLYLLVVGLVLLTGIWSAKLTWDAHLGAAHTISLAVVFWAIALVAVETLPQTPAF